MMEANEYSHPLQLGRYRKPTSRFGKYDNARRFWEDHVTGVFLAPHLEKLLARCKERGTGLRILDLGCGVGDGLDLIQRIARSRGRGIRAARTELVPSESLGEYVGVDINDDLLCQAEECYASASNVRFVRGDLSEGLPDEILLDHRPFDLYFTSYAMLSHFRDGEFLTILGDICRHAPERALFVGDWLGQYSYEWPRFWLDTPRADYFVDYRMSYLYDETERRTNEIPSFPLRLMTRDEVLRLLTQASDESGVSIHPLVTFDRSILTGRHTDTREYNPTSPPLRSAINSLLEPQTRTDLGQLLVDYVPRQGFDAVNRFYEGFFRATNDLVGYTAALLDDPARADRELPFLAQPPGLDPSPLRDSMAMMASLIGGLRSVDWGDVRANLIEPALAHALEHIEIRMQQGLGMGHSLGVVAEIAKDVD